MISVMIFINDFFFRLILKMSSICTYIRMGVASSQSPLLQVLRLNTRMWLLPFTPATKRKKDTANSKNRLKTGAVQPIFVGRVDIIL